MCKDLYAWYRINAVVSIFPKFEYKKRYHFFIYGLIKKKFKVSRRFDELAEIALSEKFRLESDWRYRYIQHEKFQKSLSSFQVLNILRSARRKVSNFKEIELNIAPCQTDTAAFVLSTEEDPEEIMEETIMRKSFNDITLI